eukprot:Partr_v1_DN28593_c0_g1_i2_m72772 putative cactin, spliceosome C complex subunit
METATAEERLKALQIENEFHLMQTRQRACLRIAERRSHAIDLLVFYASAADHPFDYDRIASDAQLRQSLRTQKSGVLGILTDAASEESEAELEELAVQTQFQLDVDSDHVDFWKAIKCILDSAGAMHHNSEIQRDIDLILKDKSVAELEALQNEVEAKLRGDVAVDVEYWELLAKSIDYHIARISADSFINSQFDRFIMDTQPMFDRMVREGKTSALNDQEEVDMNEQFEDFDSQIRFDPSMSPAPLVDVDPKELESCRVFDQADFDRRLKVLRLLVLTNNYTPRADYSIPKDTGEDPNAAISFTDKRGRKRTDKRKLAQRESLQQVNDISRATLQNHMSSHFDTSLESDRLFNAAALKELDSDEEVMESSALVDTSELQLEQILDSNRFKPRKPRFYNLVYTGFDWNRYNQTHYDSDNPPPKVVQGYRFNIFYPDLLDKSMTPSWKKMKDPQALDDDTCLIVFSAGPPYEDIAFRIVNKEWEFAHRRGFVSTFERNTLYLWFKFKRFNGRR